MRLLTISGVNTVIVPCPPGKKVRIVSIVSEINGADDFDFAFLSFSQSTELRALAAANLITSSAMQISWFVGASSSEQPQQSIDPVTGNINYAGLPVVVVGLPDIWWANEMTLKVTGNSLAVTATIVCYEQSDLPKIVP